MNNNNNIRSDTSGTNNNMSIEFDLSKINEINNNINIKLGIKVIFD